MTEKKRDQFTLCIIISLCLTTTLMALQVTDAIPDLVAAALLFLNAVALGVCIVLMQQHKAKNRNVE